MVSEGTEAFLLIPGHEAVGQRLGDALGETLSGACSMSWSVARERLAMAPRVCRRSGYLR